MSTTPVLPAKPVRGGISSGSLIPSRDFRLYWFGQALSVLGDSFSFIALPLLVLEATGSIVQMGLLTATYGIGFFFSGLFAGAIVDRVDRRRLMILCDLVRFLLHSLVPLTWWLVGPRIEILFFVVLFSALFGNAFQVAAITAVANLVEKDKLTVANGTLETTYATCYFAGPMLAGLLAHSVGAVAAIGLDALSFLASALFLYFVRFTPGERPKGKETGLMSLLGGVRFLWQQPVLRWIMLTLIASNFVASAFVDLLVFQIKKGFGYGDDMVGIALGLVSLGPIIGAAFTARLSRTFGFAKSFLLSGVGLSLAMVLVGLSQHIIMLIFFASVLGGFQVIRGVNSMSFRQEVTPDYLLGRVTAAFWCLISVAGPLGAALTTHFAEIYGVGPIISLSGLVLVLMSVIAYFSPIREGAYTFERKSVAS
jgi:MFS family permease